VAAQRGDLASIERLVAAGADPHWSDGQFTAFEWAVRFEHAEAARRLWELSDGMTYAARAGVHIPLALRMGDRATLDFVLDIIGADGCEAAAALEPLARSGAAGSEGDLHLVRALIERGVRPTPEALQQAAVQARPEMVRLLLDRGARDGWLVGCQGKVPEPFDPLAGALRASLLSLRIDMVALLLEHGADPDRRDASGATPAMLLARHVYLKETYARPPFADSSLASPSPYHDRWFAPLLRLLLEHGADLSLRDHAGRSAADYVPDDDHDRVLKRELLRDRHRATGP
jgi:ankyrin repeat protein